MATTNTNKATKTTDRDGITAIMIATGATAMAVFVAIHLAGCTSVASGSMASDQAVFAAAEPSLDGGTAVTGDGAATADGWFDDLGSSVDSDSQESAPEMPFDNAADLSIMESSMFVAFGSEGEWQDASSEMNGTFAQVSFAAVGADFDPDVDSSGSFMVYASTQHNHNADIYRKDIAGRTTTQLTNDSAQDLMPEISPDGTKVAFASDRNGNWDVFVMPVDGGPTVQVTFDEAHELHPTWSPDGTSMAYCRFNDRSDQWEIWTVAVSRPSARHFVCEGMFPRWCPDATENFLLFQRSRKRGERLHGIWVIQIRDGNGFNPTEVVASGDNAIMHPAWSPDGRTIAYTLVQNPNLTAGGMPATAEIWAVAIDGTGHTALTTGGFRNMRPTWSPDGRVFFSSNRSGIDNIWSVYGTEPDAFAPAQDVAVFPEER